MMNRPTCESSYIFAESDLRDFDIEGSLFDSDINRNEATQQNEDGPLGLVKHTQNQAT